MHINLWDLSSSVKKHQNDDEDDMKRIKKNEIRCTQHTSDRKTVKFHENKEPANDDRFVTTSFQN